MPERTYPGVYVDEVPGGVRTIAGVATSITAFVGRTQRGPENEPVTVANFGEFERVFGGLWDGNSLGFAVRDFFVNGGSQAVVVRLCHADPGNPQATDGGSFLTAADFLPVDGEARRAGLYALGHADSFNLLCIPPYRAPEDAVDVDVEVVSAAAAYCERRRAMLIVDPPKDWTSAEVALAKVADTATDHVGTRSGNAAIYFPRLRRDGGADTFAPCGAVAGLIRGDARRRVRAGRRGLGGGERGVEPAGRELFSYVSRRRDGRVGGEDPAGDGRAG